MAGPRGCPGLIWRISWYRTWVLPVPIRDGAKSAAAELGTRREGTGPYGIDRRALGTLIRARRFDAAFKPLGHPSVGKGRSLNISIPSNKAGIATGTPPTLVAPRPKRSRDDGSGPPLPLANRWPEMLGAQTPAIGTTSTAAAIRA